MAPVKVSLPQKIEFGQEGDSEERWKLFKQRYLDDALKAFNSFQLAEDATVEQIIAEFGRYIIGEINLAYERYCFNKRQQRDEESFEQFFGRSAKIDKNMSIL